MSNVTTKFTGDEKDLLRSQEAIAKGTEKISDEYRKAAKEAAELDRAAKRMLANIETPQEAHNERLKTLNRLLETGRINQEQFERATVKSHQTLRAQNTQVTSGLSNIAASVGGVVAGYVGVSQAIGGIITLIDEWDEKQKRLAEKANETARGSISFLAIQPEGTGEQRLKQVAETAQGELTVTQAADTAQAIQSVTGSFTDAIEGLKAVVAGSRVNISPELGTELVVQGLQSGLPADYMIRAAFIAGAESPRDPKAVANSAAAISQFKGDELLGATISAAIAGREPMAVRELTRAAEKALSGDGQAEGFFRSQGLDAQASREQRLNAMAAAGVDTMEEIRSVVGITEDTGARALFHVLGNWEMVSGMKQRIERQIPNSDILQQTRDKIEQDSPFVMLERLQRQSQGAFEQATSFNTDAQTRRLRHLMLREQLTKRGLGTRNLFGFEMFDEDGSLNRLRWMLGASEAQNAVSLEVSGQIQDISDTMRELKRRKPAIVQPEK